jgi:hypothetical protein
VLDTGDMLDIEAMDTQQILHIEAIAIPELLHMVGWGVVKHKIE